MGIIGRTFPRKDGVSKVTGQALFVDDIFLPGMWVGGTLRSSEVRGIINDISFDPSFNWSQVVIVTAADLPGPNFVSMVREDLPSVLYSRGIFTISQELVFTFDETALRYLHEAGELQARGEYAPPPDIDMVWDESTYRGTAYKDYSWIAYVVETEVDTDTYEIQPKVCTIVAEVGKAIHPILARGQIEGGALQALGYGYLEDFKIEDGRYLSSHLNAYLIPTSMDVPEFDVKIVEVPSLYGPYGAKGLGELPMDGGAPALASALWNATGLFPTQIPITGELLFDLERNAFTEEREKR
ncbi:MULTISPECIES: molybdopterin cofactor-binding domain-containing protein [Aminobacterium]|jgi:CO/xanthine dehydrogenase Mo-binding subunit|uniref:molybdopterin cofactor-binding domain-containing protein n=1 Tax=Aminobacterium TaxID=81466 RepID=UPI00257D57BA|nr:molybdopterin cofactor-binding domain-containing protein [Aminobacterium sp. UBA4987]